MFFVRRFTIIFFIFCSLSSNLSAQNQEITWSDVPERTGIRIVCDEAGVQIYVDGHPVGKSPLPEVVDVLPGWHRVSYFPDVSDMINANFPKRQKILDLIRLAQQDVLVEKGEVVEVVLNYRGIDREVEAYQRKVNSGRWIGFTMILAVMIVLAWAT